MPESERDGKRISASRLVTSVPGPVPVSETNGCSQTETEETGEEETEKDGNELDTMLLLPREIY